jgi:ABC-2 type transport system ATP-binding protein
MDALEHARPAVNIADLVVDRGAKRVLSGISASIPRGSLTALLGPSGSGKTTFLRAIVGVQPITSGSVTVLGRPAGAGALRKLVGYVTQAPSVYSDLTVRENARYFASLHGLPAVAGDQAIADVGLTAAADQLTGLLSGGQRSRVSLACALLGGPELLVLDEPTVGLDPVLRRDLWSLFRRLADEGSTLLVSSHVMDEAEHCDRILLMREGRLLADATCEDLQRQAGAASVEDAFLRLVARREFAA